MEATTRARVRRSLPLGWGRRVEESLTVLVVLPTRTDFGGDGYPLRQLRSTGAPDSALAQCLTEHLLHLGEVEAMLWQMDVEPPSAMWIARRVLHGKWPPPRSALVGGRMLNEERGTRPTSPPSRGKSQWGPKIGAVGRRQARGGGTRVDADQVELNFDSASNPPPEWHNSVLRSPEVYQPSHQIGSDVRDRDHARSAR